MNSWTHYEPNDWSFLLYITYGYDENSLHVIVVVYDCKKLHCFDKKKKWNKQVTSTNIKVSYTMEKYIHVKK